MVAMAGAEIVRLRAERDAKPAIEKSQSSHKVTGPKKVTKKERLIPQAGGLAPIKETETVTEIESEETTKDSLLKETPAFVLAHKPVTSWLYASSSPLALQAVEVGGGLIFRETLGIGAGWAFHGRAEERARLIVQVYFK